MQYDKKWINIRNNFKYDLYTIISRFISKICWFIYMEILYNKYILKNWIQIYLLGLYVSLNYMKKYAKKKLFKNHFSTFKAMPRGAKEILILVVSIHEFFLIIIIFGTVINSYKWHNFDIKKDCK